MIISLYAGILALVFVALSVYVIIRRYRLVCAIGDAEDFELKRRIRAHANFVEYTPLFLILMGYAEFAGLAHFWIHSLSSIFLLGRASHALSVLRLEKYENGKILAYPIWRSLGMVCSFSTIIITACILIVHSL